MKYLLNYDLSEEDLQTLQDTLTERDILELSTNQERVEEILNHFLSVGIHNLKELLLYKINLFYDNPHTIMNFLATCSKDTIDKINEDVQNLDLLNM